MKKVKKGNYGYLSYAKKKQFLITFFAFLIPIVIFVTGYLYTKTRLNIMTFVAILGCLPACKAMVSLIMLNMYKSADPSVYEEAKAAAGDLVSGYDLVFTAYEHTSPVNALVVCGDHVVCYTPDEKTDCAYLEKHITRILTVNEFPSVDVKVLKDIRKYANRVKDLQQNQDHYREGIEYTPDERYPELSREEYIFHILLAISL